MNQGKPSHQEAQSLHAKELEEKGGMAERMAETKYTEQRQFSENQAEMLKI